MLSNGARELGETAQLRTAVGGAWPQKASVYWETHFCRTWSDEEDWEKIWRADRADAASWWASGKDPQLGQIALISQLTELSWPNISTVSHHQQRLWHCCCCCCCCGCCCCCFFFNVFFQINIFNLLYIFPSLSLPLSHLSVFLFCQKSGGIPWVSTHNWHIKL